MQISMIYLDAAGNTATVTQEITFTNPKPPVWKLSTRRILACEDDPDGGIQPETLVKDGWLISPCNMKLTVSYEVYN